jgi:flagella basal body P-ring formation protein FlgA
MRPLLLVGLMVATSTVAAPRAELELVPHAPVATGQVMLGDIVRVRSDDLALIRRLVNLPIGEAPQPGDSAAVRREVLSDWVRRTTGLPDESLRWSGADAARVIRASRQLRGEEIAGAAMDGLRHRMGAAGTQADLRVRASIRDVDIPEGRLQLSPRSAESGVALRNRALVWVDAWVNDRFVRSFPVTVEIVGVSGQPVLGPLAASGNPMAPDGANVADATAVTRGEWAALRTTSGAVSLESRVEVLQDGRVGQRIRVRTSASATGVVFAKVIGPGQLELTP